MALVSIFEYPYDIGYMVHIQNVQHLILKARALFSAVKIHVSQAYRGIDMAKECMALKVKVNGEAILPSSF